VHGLSGIFRWSPLRLHCGITERFPAFANLLIIRISFLLQGESLSINHPFLLIPNAATPPVMLVATQAAVKPVPGCPVITFGNWQANLQSTPKTYAISQIQ
jgi:hypothetical protein